MTASVLSGKARRRRGVVLIAVLWIVAALSIIVTGVVHAVRGEIRLVSQSKHSVVAAALGDAAIHLVLQELMARPERQARLTNVDVVYQGTPIRVQILPLNGLIDINNAPEPLLARLFSIAGQADEQTAGALARAVVETRAQKDGRGRPLGFEAVEDLLRVPGVDYSLYANISRLVTADQPGSGKVNPMAAPEPVLAVLAGGNVLRAAAIAAQRDSGAVGIDTTALNGESIDNATTQRYRLQARVPLSDSAWLLFSRSVDLGVGMQQGLPWRTFHTEQRSDAMPDKGS